jgi:ribosomal 30S subunit maturation factor RimM
MSSDPVSWLMIEHGWKVVDPHGHELGTVAEVLGDTANDIFSGLSVASGLLHRPRYVPAEHVTRIVEGEVEVDLDQDEFDRLAEYEEPS